MYFVILYDFNCTTKPIPQNIKQFQFPDSSNTFIVWFLNQLNLGGIIDFTKTSYRTAIKKMVTINTSIVSVNVIYFKMCSLRSKCLHTVEEFYHISKEIIVKLYRKFV